MRNLLPRIAAAAAALFLIAAAPASAPAHGSGRVGTPAGTQVVMQAQPGTPLDRAARQLLADDLAAAGDRGEQPLLLIGTAPLGGARPALFVQMQSPRECGSAGCATSVYAWTGAGWSRVLDGTTGRLLVARTRTKGMADLLSDDERYVWNGSAYGPVHPAPAVDLRPHRPRRH